jgi:hypothetical protein
MPETFVSNYSWLLAPGDHMAADYTSPTRVSNWLQTNSVTIQSDKQKCYGQWIAQLLQNQLGIPLVTLYKDPQGTPTEWPLTLRADFVAVLDDYFESYMEQQQTSA